MRPGCPCAFGTGRRPEWAEKAGERGKGRGKGNPAQGAKREETGAGGPGGCLLPGSGGPGGREPPPDRSEVGTRLPCLAVGVPGSWIGWFAFRGSSVRIDSRGFQVPVDCSGKSCPLESGECLQPLRLTPRGTAEKIGAVGAFFRVNRPDGLPSPFNNVR